MFRGLHRLKARFKGTNSEAYPHKLTPLQKAQKEYANNQRQRVEDTDIPKEKAMSPRKKKDAELKKQKKETSPFNKLSHKLLYVFFVSGLIGTGYLLSPYGHVNQVNVEGNTQVPEQLIIDASQITPKKTMFGTLSNQDTIATQIQKKLPKIKKVTVRWQGVNNVLLEVTDYKTVAYLEKKSSYQSVLENGNVLSEEEVIPRGNQTILKNFKSGFLLDQLIQELNDVSEEIQNSISDISYTGTEVNPNEIILFMNDGNQIKANIRDFSNKIGYYPDILDQIGEQKGVIDMEVGIFFQPFEYSTDTSNENESIDLEISE